MADKLKRVLPRLELAGREAELAVGVADQGDSSNGRAGFLGADHDPFHAASFGGSNLAGHADSAATRDRWKPDCSMTPAVRGRGPKP